MGKRFLFLDVDGVLNTHDVDPDVACGQIHREKVARLNRILRATGALIVLSSAWRYIIHRGESNLQGLEWLFRSHGLIAGRLFDVTRPDTMERGIFDGTARSWPVTDERGRQISDWFLGRPEIRFASYVVLDDLDLGIRAAGHPFVQTVPSVGLTDDDADRAIELLAAGVVVFN